MTPNEPQEPKVMLIILDGWGVAPPSRRNAISQARTPFFDSLVARYMATTLQASGIGVGLPYNEEGNSEVGHMNIGAGRIVYQFLPRITQDLRDGSFYSNPAFLSAAQHAKKHNARVHILGLFSTGNIHGSAEHVHGLLDTMKKAGVTNTVIHPFTDGKDGKNNEGAEMIQQLISRLSSFTHTLPGTLMGRMYSLDRNNQWDLTQASYEALCGTGSTPTTNDPVAYIKNWYQQGKTDYDLPPVMIQQNGKTIPRIQDNDALIFTDFREDSVRQITRSFALPDDSFKGFKRNLPKNLLIATMTEYEKGLPALVAYPPPQTENPIASTLSKARKRQLHVAETEKYAHVTYFFNGENEVPFPGEDRIFIRSTGGPHYETNPKMQAATIARETTTRIDQYDFFVLNLANADMMGHTGHIDAAIQGVETIDAILYQLIETALTFHVTVVITADHGNAELMIDPKTGSIVTSHTNNPVPFILIGKGFEQPKNTRLYQIPPQGILADVAPTILHLMGVHQPIEMTGESLLYKLIPDLQK